MCVISVVDIVENDTVSEPFEERHSVKPLPTVIMIFDSDSMDEYDNIMSAINAGGYYT